MSRIFIQLSETILKLGADLKNAEELAEQAKKEMILLNKAALRKMGLTTGDIDNMVSAGKEVWLEGFSTPRFQASDAQIYIESRKIKPSIR